MKIANNGVFEKKYNEIELKIIIGRFLVLDGAFLEVSLSCKNILDQHQKDIDVGAEKDSQYLYGPVLPRSFYLGVKLSF